MVAGLGPRSRSLWLAWSDRRLFGGPAPQAILAGVTRGVIADGDGHRAAGIARVAFLDCLVAHAVQLVDGRLVDVTHAGAERKSDLVPDVDFAGMPGLPRAVAALRLPQRPEA